MPSAPLFMGRTSGMPDLKPHLIAAWENLAQWLWPLLVSGLAAKWERKLSPSETATAMQIRTSALTLPPPPYQGRGRRREHTLRP